MAKKLTRQVEIEFARILFAALVDAAENQDDEVYELMDPEYEYDEKELCSRLNNDTIKEVIALGFKAKYGVESTKANGTTFHFEMKKAKE